MKSKLGSGARFKKLSGSVAKEYEKKGESPAAAKKSGAAIAAKIGREKYGAKKMAIMAARGREDAQGRRR